MITQFSELRNEFNEHIQTRALSSSALMPSMAFEVTPQQINENQYNEPEEENEIPSQQR